jgi:hypothetical protein
MAVQVKKVASFFAEKYANSFLDFHTIFNHMSES